MSAFHNLETLLPNPSYKKNTCKGGSFFKSVDFVLRQTVKNGFFIFYISLLKAIIFDFNLLLSFAQIVFLGGANLAGGCPSPPPKVTLGGGEAIFLKIFKNTCRMTMIRCALESPDLGQPFKYLGRYHITHRNFFRAT